MVGSHSCPECAFGLADMSGNAWEWTRSLWGSEQNEPRFKYPYNPKDGRENLKAGNEVRRVLRGGSFNDSGRSVRAALRNLNEPGGRSYNFGFRVVVSRF